MHLHLCGWWVQIIHMHYSKEKQNLSKGDKLNTGEVFGDPNGSPHFPPPCRLRQ